MQEFTNTFKISYRHSSEGWNPVACDGRRWIPAFAGTTKRKNVVYIVTD
jgi:hypothetical protein